jgi:hypothetical protein
MRESAAARTPKKRKWMPYPSFMKTKVSSALFASTAYSVTAPA